MGELKTDVEATPKQLRSAIITGTKDLGMRSISESGDELQSRYIFRTHKLTNIAEIQFEDLLSHKNQGIQSLLLGR